VSVALEAAGLVVSPYSNPFYTDALIPLVAAAFPPAELAELNAAAEPRLFVTAADVGRNARAIFTQPDISGEALRASAGLPTVFKAVVIDGVPYWDGGYLGNPALSPLVDHAQDLLLVLVNPFERAGMPPQLAPAILDRIREITFNASVVLEINAIEAVNRLLADVAAMGAATGAATGAAYSGRYRPIRLHAIRNDPFVATLGFASKNSTSWALLTALRDVGIETADAWLRENGGRIGRESSMDVKGMLDDVLKAGPKAGGTR
jgi:NTE family protein